MDEGGGEGGRGREGGRNWERSGQGQGAAPQLPNPRKELVS